MPSSSKEALQIRELRMCYPLSDGFVLEGLNLRIKARERIALIGSSGSGKSTVAKALLGLLPKGSNCQGEVIVSSQNLLGLTELEIQNIRGRQIGLVFQDPMTRLNPLMTSQEHLLDLLQFHFPKQSSNWLRRTSEDLLIRVGIDGSRFNSYPHELSGGMRQRLAIALAIALKPSLVIADEPTTSLDVLFAHQVMSELASLCDEFESSLLLITHDLALASKWCQKIAILDQGKIVEEGPCNQVLHNPQSYVGKRLLSAAVERERINSFTTLHSNTVLEVNNLRCWHQNSIWPWESAWIKSVDDVSFSIGAGETLGVVGTSGCGKTTLCRALIGLLPVRGGEVKILGKDIFKLRDIERRDACKLLQMVFQDPLASLNPQMTIGEAIADPLLVHGLKSPSQSKPKVRELLEKVGLIPVDIFQSRFPKELSGGQQQRVAIARALALNPKILICDESLSMLDPESQIEVLALLRSLQNELGLAILFITHDLTLASGFCHKLIVLKNGRIVDAGDSRRIFKEPKSNLTKQLIQTRPKLELI